MTRNLIVTGTLVGVLVVILIRGSASDLVYLAPILLALGKVVPEPKEAPRGKKSAAPKQR